VPWSAEVAVEVVRRIVFPGSAIGIARRACLG
jgi:hypothetical protein